VSCRHLADKLHAVGCAEPARGFHFGSEIVDQFIQQAAKVLLRFRGKSQPRQSLRDSKAVTTKLRTLRLETGSGRRESVNGQAFNQLQKTIEGFATRYKTLIQKIPVETLRTKLKFWFVMNRPALRFRCEPAACIRSASRV